MKFSHRAIGAAVGTAVLGLAALAIAGTTAGHPSHPQAATLAAVSRARPTADPASKRAAAEKQITGRKPGTGYKPVRGGKQGGAGSARPAGPSGPPAREGRIIPAGAKDAGGELVFYGVRIHLRQLPGTTFGIMAGLRDTSGALTPEVETNETTGSGTAPGFHAVEAPTSVGSPAVAIPEFGYYSGPAATITALDNGRIVHAHQARWSANHGIVIFWFLPPAAPAGATLTGLAAHDAAGHQLPGGHPSPGQG